MREVALLHRAVREDVSDKVNFKVRSEDSKGVKQEDSRGRALQAMGRVGIDPWAGEAGKCVCCIGGGAKRPL